MADFFWFWDEQWALPQDTRGMPRVDDRRVLSGIVDALKSGGRWSDCLEPVYARCVGAHLRSVRRGRGCACQAAHR